MVSGQLQRTDVDLDVVDEEVFGQLADFLGPSGGPHECLPVRSNLRDDAPDLGLETHVQHAVGLVQHEVRAAAQVGLLDLQQVDEPVEKEKGSEIPAGQSTDGTRESLLSSHVRESRPSSFEPSDFALLPGLLLTHQELYVLNRPAGTEHEPLVLYHGDLY